MTPLLLMPAVAGPPALGALEPLRPFIDACWTAPMPGGASDRHCFTAIYGGKHVRDVHEVTSGGRVVYAGESLYSAAGEAIGFVYLNSLGGSGRGAATPAAGGLDLILDMRASPADAPRRYATTWRLTPEGYDATTDGQTAHFRREAARP